MQGHLSFIHNQLFMIVIGIIAVIVATIIGLEMYSSSVVQDNRDAIVNDLKSISNSAIIYYKKDKEMGGGGGSFIGFVFSESLSKNPNGTYKIVYIKDQKVLLEGVGAHKVNSFLGFTEGDDYITTQLLIRPNETVLNQIN